MGGTDGDSNTYMVTVMAKAGGEMEMMDVTVTVTDVDELGTLTSPTIPADYAENDTADLGTFTIMGAGADSVMWSLGGADADDFSIDGGVLAFKAAPDYENPMGGTDGDSNTYMVTVMAKAGGEMEMMDVTVMVTDVVELGTLEGDASHTYAEDRTDAVGTYTTMGGDGSTVAWSLGGADADDFSIDGGVLAFKAAPDYENPMGGTDGDSNTYMVTVMAEAGGEMEMMDVTVMVTDVVELGTLEGDASHTYAEDRTDAVGTYTTMGGDGSTVAWSLGGADADDFSIDGGVLAFKAAPDYENPMGGTDGDSNTYMVTVMAEAGGKMEMIDVTVMVTDVVELGTLEGDASHTYAEDRTDAVGTYTTMGGDGSTVAWSLGGADADDFSIDGGVLAFKAAPDYENPMGGTDGDSNTYMVTVMAEAGGKMEMMDVTVMVTDVVELGTLEGDASHTYAEDRTDAVGTYTTMGGDGSTVAWSLGGADAGDFNITGGSLTFAASPDYENPADADGDNTYMVTVMAEAGGEMAEMAVTVTVTDANDEPMFAQATATLSIDENTAARMNIGGPVMATDEDGDRLTYTLSGMDAASFDIGGSTGQLMTKAALDYETKSSYSVTVMATDTYNASDSIAVTITVTDVNEAPSFPSATANRSVAENTAAGTDIGAPVAATDADGDMLTYSLAGTDAASFSIDSGTGHLMTSAALDYETKMSYTVMVTATDPDGASASTTVTIMVTDVDDVVITPDPNADLIARYDAVANGGNGNGMIDKAEVIAAINDYLFPPGGVEVITKAEVIRLINLYLFPGS